MFYRSDLAVECLDTESDFAKMGIQSSEEQTGRIKIERVKITQDEGEKYIGKPKGTYVTVRVPSFSEAADEVDEQVRLISSQIEKMLPKEGTVLVVGLGNPNATPDAIGPKTADRILSTRHLIGELTRAGGLESLRSVACVSFGVLGQTGIESYEIICSVAERIKPSAVIAIDALAARSMERLGTTVQICDSGVSPGSGVGNHRREISRKTLGVPVIAIGIPTVVDCETLVRDMIGSDGGEIGARSKTMMVTPKEIDLLIDKAGYVLSLAINMALQPLLSPEEILALTQ